MREYLFIGKRKDNGEWITGNLSIEYDGATTVSFWASELTDASVNFWEPIEKYHEVIPETIGQFTGRYDKTSNKIFEGTIMNGKFGTGFGGKSTKYKEFNFAIIYHEPTSSFSIEMPKGYGNYRFHPHWEHCEIIGTIHDNPELLQSL